MDEEFVRMTGNFWVQENGLIFKQMNLYIYINLEIHNNGNNGINQIKMNSSSFLFVTFRSKLVYP